MLSRKQKKHIANSTYLNPDRRIRLVTYRHTKEGFCLGYEISKNLRNKGLTTLKVKELLSCFSPHKNDIWACTTKDNISSIRVLEKSGFEPIDNLWSYDPSLIWHQWITSNP